MIYTAPFGGSVNFAFNGADERYIPALGNKINIDFDIGKDVLDLNAINTWNGFSNLELNWATDQSNIEVPFVPSAKHVSYIANGKINQAVSAKFVSYTYSIEKEFNFGGTESWDGFSDVVLDWTTNDVVVESKQFKAYGFNSNSNFVSELSVLSGTRINLPRPAYKEVEEQISTIVSPRPSDNSSPIVEFVFGDTPSSEIGLLTTFVFDGVKNPPAIPGSNVEFIFGSTAKYPVEISAKGYTGSSAFGELFLYQSIANSNGLSGETFVSSLTERLQPFNGVSPRIEVGSELLSTLLVEARLYSNIGVAQELKSDLKIAPQALLATVIGTGESVTSPLSTFTVFGDSNALSGQELKSSLTERPQLIFDSKAYSGQESNSSISVSMILKSDGYSGEQFVSSITVFQNPGLPLSDGFKNGQELLASLSYSQSFPSNGYSGEASNATLATETAFGLSNSYVGQELKSSLENNPADELAIKFETGSVSEANYFNIQLIRLGTFIDSGAEFTSSLSTIPPVSISTLNGSGSSVSIQLSETVLPFIRVNAFETGQYVVGTLSSAPFDRIYVGQELASNLITLVAFPFEAGTGTILSSTLTERPQVKFVSTFHTGYDLSGSVLLPRMPFFKAVFGTGSRFSANMESETNFDLSTCPIETQIEDFSIYDIGRGDDDRYLGNWQYSGCPTVMEASLSVRARFSARAYSGSVLYPFGKELDLGLIEFNIGTNANVTHMILDNNVHLCVGNYIPDGDHVDFELTVVDSTDCKTEIIRVGTEMKASMYFSVFNLKTVLWASQELKADLTTFPKPPDWVPVKTYVGEDLDATLWTDVSLYYRAATGASSSCTLYEPNNFIYTGSAMSIGPLIVETSVRLLEEGLIENQYIPVSEDGDFIFDLATPATVELEFYKHDLKAECY